MPSSSPKPPSLTTSVPELVFGLGVIEFVAPRTRDWDVVCIVLEPLTLL